MISVIDVTLFGVIDFWLDMLKIIVLEIMLIIHRIVMHLRR